MDDFSFGFCEYNSLAVFVHNLNSCFAFAMKGQTRGGELNSTTQRLKLHVDFN